MTTHGATLNGTVNPNGVITTYWFELDTSHGKIFSLEESLTGEGDLTVSYDVIELQPETEYHFRLVAKNEHGTVYGMDEFFTTLPDETFAPTVTTLPATNIS